ncbi:carboxylate--amine ligase/circularly permuted type 2 ATP-grasp protein [Phycicoccus sp. CSK15P-2]|uniref:carboxylate--amine ligase/circularly permuted type 2 ATP-grasp protein n=1 Tax=Phycicoccus sp. CSK15P-2 TaxID=2807627 RepID=UPI0027DAEACF|nr:carboxylate--amine ligase/circularly permuted type 2 ATP-grasp protein [Phycicoccus sp. CSK15P-2]
MTDLTLGVEEELHLVDLSSRRLTSQAPALLERLPAESFSSELQRTTVETNTGVVTTLDGLRDEVLGLRRRLVEVAGPRNIGIAAAATLPMTDPGDSGLTSSGRFARMQDDYRLLVDEQLICGTQFHVGVEDRDLAIRVIHRVTPDIPTLLALSASSPMWRGADTGYASIRTLLWQRWPTSGSFGRVFTAGEYDALLEDLIRSGVVSDSGMAYFDLRPSSHLPTIELRICDALPLVDDAMLVAGLFRASVAAALEAEENGAELVPRPVPLHRAAVWRAARSGMTGSLLDGHPSPEPAPAPDVARGLLARLRPHLEASGDWDTVSELLHQLLSRGTSSERQRVAFARRGRLEDVVEQVVKETQHEWTAPQPAPHPVGYPESNADEAFTPSSAVREAYEDVVDHVTGLDTADLAQRMERRDAWLTDVGMTFGVDDEQRPFEVDLLPRLVPPQEWTMLSRGLAQRARAIEMFLQDVYGDARVVKDGVVPESVVTGSPGWRDVARRLPYGVVRAAIQGFDLVRDDNVGWRVLEDNVRMPSGAGYALAVRRLMDEVMDDLPRPDGLLSPESGPGVLRDTLRSLSDADDPCVVLLTDGPSNSAYFEQKLLADEAGLRLAVPDDIGTDDGRVTVDGVPVDVVYLRTDLDVAELRSSDDRPVGEWLLDAAVARTIALVNAPGNGVADDKEMYVHVPDLIAYYLDERPIIEPVPTYRCEDPEERAVVLERLDQIVTKPVDGHGGGGVLVGPDADEEELRARAEEIRADPERYIAQETVVLSTLPTLDGGGLAPRHVDLRAFVYLTGTGPHDARVADLALTRTAPAGSMVVNSSQGGGAKDTWILGDEGDAMGQRR